MTTPYAYGQAAALAFFKLATVPHAVKQYRRALAGFDAATRSAREGGPISRGFALHGTPDLARIIEDRRVEASPLGPTGQYGSGAYFWRGFPRRTDNASYLQHLNEEGLATDLASMPNKRPVQSNVYGSGSSNRDSVVSGPADYLIRPKDTAIIDTATRQNNRSLGAVLADAQDARMRTMDTAIFQRARQQQLRANAKNPLPAPTKQELVALLRRRQAGIT